MFDFKITSVGPLRNCLKKIVIMSSFTLAMTGVSMSSAHAISLGTAGDYNAFIFGSFISTSSDVEGRLAAGGDVTLGSTVGSGLATDQSGTTDTLIVGKTLTWTNAEVQNGNVKVGGAAYVSGGAKVKDGNLNDNLGANLPIDFATEKTNLESLSAELASRTVNGTAQSQYGGISLSGDGTSALQVFNITGSALSTSTYYSFITNNIPIGTTLLFNVSGASVTMNGGTNIFYTGQDLNYNVLFNFYEATSLTIQSIAVPGSILAPYASVTANNGNIDGTIIAASWTGGMELHNVPFESTSSSPDPVPEPSTMMLLGTGLIGLAGLARRVKQ